MKKQEKRAMCRRLVYYCVAMLSVTAIWAMVVKTAAVFLDYQMTVDVTDVVTFVGAAFGGELLMLLAKRIFAKETEE